MDKLNPDLKSTTFPRTEFNKLDITTLRGALTGALVGALVGAANDGATATSPTQEWVEATTERVDAFLAAHAPSASLSSIALGFYHYFQPTLEQACKAIVENSFDFQHEYNNTTDNTTIEGTINGDTIDPGLEEADEEETDEEENQHQSLLELASLEEMDVLSIKETADGIVVVDVVVDLGENTGDGDGDGDESDGTIKGEGVPENTLSKYPTFHSYFLNIVLEHAKSSGLTDDEANTRLKYHTRSTQELERHTTTERHLLLQQIASIAASTPLRDVLDFAGIRKLQNLHAETNQLFTAVRSVILWDYLDCFFGEDSRIFCFNCFGQYINTEGGLIANRVEV
jgi:hypothetical protein